LFGRRDVKLQIPSTKLQKNLKLQAPNFKETSNSKHQSEAGERHLKFDVWRFSEIWNLKFEVWNFSGAWALVFGPFFSFRARHTSGFAC
jgi:hypothetical protein